MSRTIVLPALLALLGACGQAGDPPAGDRVQLPTQDRPVAAPSVVYTVGGQDGPQWQSFAHVAHLAFDSEENLYVMDRGVGKVFVYDPTGKFMREIGRPGNGPGELGFPLQMAVTREGTVVVSDMRRRSFSMFQRDGKYVEELPYEYRRALGGLEVRPHPRGGFVAVYQPKPGIKPDTGYLRLTWHSLNIDDEPQLLAAVRADPARLGAGTARLNQPAFSHGFYWGVLPSGQAAVAHSTTYRIDIFSPDGTLAQTLERPIAGRRTTAGDRQAERQRRMEHLVEDMATAPASVRQAAMKDMEALTFAEVMPVIQDMSVDPAGRIWVRRGTGVDMKGGSIDLISGDGTYLGTFAGSRVPVAYSPGGLAAYVELDELEVQHVVVRRVPGSWGPVALR